MNIIFDKSFNKYKIKLYEEVPSAIYNFDFHYNTQEICTITLYRLDKILPVDDIILHTQQKYFSSMDYYQQHMLANPKFHGLCGMLHNYIIMNYKKFPIPIKNIYSSLSMHILGDGMIFWNSRVKKGKAEYVYSLQRYRIFVN